MSARDRIRKVNAYGKQSTSARRSLAQNAITILFRHCVRIIQFWCLNFNGKFYTRRDGLRKNSPIAFCCVWFFQLVHASILNYFTRLQLRIKSMIESGLLCGCLKARIVREDCELACARVYVIVRRPIAMHLQPHRALNTWINTCHLACALITF